MEVKILKNNCMKTVKPNKMIEQPFINVISLGAGKQSSYMLLKALQGAYKFKPDFAIFSDTGAEPSWTYSYLDVLKKYCKEKYDFDIIVVKNTETGLLIDTLNYINGNSTRVAMLPLRVKPDGHLMLRQCTSDYKINPLRRYLQKIRNGKKIRLWIGISIDEFERQKDSNVKYIENWYPLIEDRISITDIKKWFQSQSDIEEPGKSSCICCPFRSRKQWKYIKEHFPSDYFIAEKFDNEIRNFPKIIGEAYIHPDLKPLSEINYTDNQLRLFPELIEECFGLCGI
jgi:hypothetical protein